MAEIEKLEKQKEQIDLINELSKIDKYIYNLKIDHRYSVEIQNFIIETVNKYRYKLEVKNYYMNQNGVDNIEGSQYDTLIVLKSMIKQYAFIKYGKNSFRDEEGE